MGHLLNPLKDRDLHYLPYIYYLPYISNVVAGGNSYIWCSSRNNARPLTISSIQKKLQIFCQSSPYSKR